MQSTPARGERRDAKSSLRKWSRWSHEGLLKVLEPFYPVAGCGRRSYALEAMLRVHLRIDTPARRGLLEGERHVGRSHGLPAHWGFPAEADGWPDF